MCLSSSTRHPRAQAVADAAASGTHAELPLQPRAPGPSMLSMGCLLNQLAGTSAGQRCLGVDGGHAARGGGRCARRRRAGARSAPRGGRGPGCGECVHLKSWLSLGSGEADASHAGAGTSNSKSKQASAAPCVLQVRGHVTTARLLTKHGLTMPVRCCCRPAAVAPVPAGKPALGSWGPTVGGVLG